MGNILAPSGVRGTPQVTRLVIVLSVARLGLAGYWPLRGCRGPSRANRLSHLSSVVRLGLDIGPCGGVGDRLGQTVFGAFCQRMAWGWIPALAGASWTVPGKAFATFGVSGSLGAGCRPFSGVSGIVSGKSFGKCFFSGSPGAGFQPLRGCRGPSWAKRLLPLLSVVRLGLDTRPFRGCQGPSRANVW